MSKIDYRVDELMNLHTMPIGKIAKVLKDEGFEDIDINAAINKFIRSQAQSVTELDQISTLNKGAFLMPERR